MSSTRRLFALLAIVLLVGSTAPASAGKSEPLPPGQGGDDNEVPSRPVPPPTTPSAVDATAPPVVASGRKFSPLDWQNAIGVYARYLFVTNLMLKPYLLAATQMNSFDVGVQYIRRYEKFDVVTSVDFSWLPIDNGNWLARGNDPSLDTKFVQFDKLSFLSADVSIVGHHAFNNWLELRGGAGLGLGVVFGNVLTTNDSSQVCNKQTASDIKQCFPISPTVGPIALGKPTTEGQLKQTEDSSKLDSAGDPHRKHSFKPPVMAVLNIFMALNFRLHRNVSTQVELGFRDAMFVGANFQYHF